MAAPNKPEDKSKEKEQASERNLDAPMETTPAEQEGANRRVEDETSGKLFGDTTSTRGDANIQGYHGRDGGVAQGTTNNPAADENADVGANAPSDSGEVQHPAEEAEQTQEVKKL
jgi:hypothetical protein